MRIELPRWTVARGASLALILACTGLVEWVLARHPDAPRGAGLVLGAALLLWQLWQVRNTSDVRAACLGADGRWAVLTPRGFETAVLLPGPRVLGHGVVLRWRTERGVRSAWLTTLDVPESCLRRLRLRLTSAAARAAA